MGREQRVQGLLIEYYNSNNNRIQCYNSNNNDIIVLYVYRIRV